MRFKKKKTMKDMNPEESKFLKLFSEEELSLLKSKEVEDLKQIIAETNATVIKAKKEMDSNPEFIAAKEKVDDFRGAFNDTKKYANTKKDLCLYLLQLKGIVDCGLSEEF